MFKEKHSPPVFDTLPGSTVNKESHDRSFRWALLAILVIGVFYFATIQSGQGWGDDFAMYIRHAMNIADGLPYDQTGYIPNPRNIIAPVAYPPIFPLLLAPVYKVWGFNLTAMKVELILFFLLSLWTIFLALRRELEWPYLIAILVLTGFNPWVWQFKEQILSDIPYLFFTYLGIYLIHKAYGTKRDVSGQILYGFLTGIAIYLSYGARTVGVVLLLALIIYDLLKNRRPSVYMVSTAVMAFALIYIQKIAMRSDATAGYADQIVAKDTSLIYRLEDMAYHCWFLLQSLNEYLNNGYSKLFRWGVFAFILITAAAAYLIRARKISKITILEIFLLIYLAPLIIMPIGLEARYLLPLIPLILLYTFTSVQAVSRRFGKETLAFAAVTCVFLATYLGRYSRLDLKSLHEGVGKAESQQLFEYVKRETTENDVLLFRKPRALNLFTGRTGAVWHKEPDDGKLWEYFGKIHAAYLITGPAEVEPIDQAFIRSFAERNGNRLQETFANADFHVYRLNPDANRDGRR